MQAGTAALFEVAGVSRECQEGAAGPGSSALATAVELEAVALLLRRGHKVAVPVVDDDGVDLVVNYRTTVQVKVTRQRNGSGTPHLQLKRNSYDRRRVRVDGSVARPRGRGLAAHVDVLLVLVAGVGWYVLPRSVVNPSGVVFTAALDQWFEAWSVFDAAGE